MSSVNDSEGPGSRNHGSVWFDLADGAAPVCVWGWVALLPTPIQTTILAVGSAHESRCLIRLSSLQRLASHVSESRDAKVVLGGQSEDPAFLFK